jgi:protein O-mannosyl-transferase
MSKRKRSSKNHVLRARLESSAAHALPRGDGRSPALEPGTQNSFVVPAVCGFLLLAVVLVFGQTIRYDFVNYDDQQYVYENPHVTSGLTAEGIAWAFTSGHASNWHPLTWFSHMLDCQLYGIAPGGHHLTNFLLHATTAILLFLVLRRMTGDLWPSAFVAAVFAIHPLRVESVAWVSERKDILCGLFFMLTLWAYLGYVRHSFSPARYLAVIVLFALGLMAKPMLVTLPFVLLLLDYWPLGRMSLTSEGPQFASGSSQSGRFSIPARLVIEKIPFLVLSAASCVVTFWAQSSEIAVNENVSLSLRFCNALVSYAAYLGQMFYPAGLALSYPYPNSWLDMPMWKVAGALLLLVAICCCVFILRRRSPYLLVGWMWYMVMLLPVIGLIKVGSQSMADRYTYLPQIGLYIAIAWVVRQVTLSWAHRGLACGISSGLVLTTLMGCAWRQTTFWRDSETLWTRTLECTSQNWLAHGGFADALTRMGQFSKAIYHYEQALKINPALPKAYYNIGNALEKMDRPQEAIKYYQQALQLKPDFSLAHYNLGVLLTQTGRPQEAIEHYREALRLNPDDPEVYNNLGVALVKTGRPGDAIEYYRQAVKLKPDFTNAYLNLALAFAKTHQPSEAAASAQKALELARSQGNTALAKQIEDWLKSYRLGQSNLPDTQSSREPVSPLP